MFDFIVVLCLAGAPKDCMLVGQPTPDCVRSFIRMNAQRPDNYEVRAITCVRHPEMELPPMTIKPSEEPEEKKDHIST